MHGIKIVGSCVPQPVHRREEGREAQGSPDERWRSVWLRYEQDEARRVNLKVLRAMLEMMGPPPLPAESMKESLRSMDRFLGPQLDLDALLGPQGRRFQATRRTA